MSYIPIDPSEPALASIIPKDDTRFWYADGRARCALDYLLLHEFCHIRNGHCQLACAKGISVISELELRSVSDRLSEDQRMMMQAFEMDADAFAAQHTFLREVNELQAIGGDWIRGLHNIGKLDNWPDIDPNRGLLIFDWIFAISAMFWILGFEFIATEIPMKTHPPAAMRSINVFGVAMNMMASKEDEDRIGYLGYYAAWMLAESLARISGGTLPKEISVLFENVKSETFRPHLSLLKQMWKKIRPELLEHSYMTNLAP
jgi:hypothetical protein